MLEHADISHLSGFHTPSSARYFIEYTGSNLDELKEAVRFSNEQNLPILTISGGKNLLLAFDEYPGLVIHNNSNGYELIQNTKDKIQNRGISDNKNNPKLCTLYSALCIRVASGHPIWELAESLEQDHNITFWHRFLGLPGSIGGAVFGNAGCFGLEIGPYVERVYILDLKNGLELEKTGVELDFKYRWSECKNHPEWFLLSVVCDLSENREKYAAPEEEPLLWRERVQPEGYSCGSFFKNPSREQSAGSLIEQVGLKGYHHKGAYFSDKHANFLMSDGTATWTDLVELVELAQKNIFDATGIQLEPEVRIIRPN
ncbi:MAG: FAD-binding protein [Candidatus Gracilibacteria bacterium]|jgi:UDP-N-acetylmuramate dehydrogenase